MVNRLLVVERAGDDHFWPGRQKCLTLTQLGATLLLVGFASTSKLRGGELIPIRRRVLSEPVYWCDVSVRSRTTPHIGRDLNLFKEGKTGVQRF